ETIHNSINVHMKNGEQDKVQEIFAKIGENPSIASVKIFDESGRILASANKDDINKLINITDLLAYRSGRTSYPDDVDGQKRYNTLLTFENSSECNRCHDPGQKVLGILSLQLSLQDAEILQTTSRNTTLLTAIAGI